MSGELCTFDVSNSSAAWSGAVTLHWCT